MPRISIRVVGAELVAKNMQDLSREIPRISKDHIKKLGKRVIDQMKKYPPQRAGSTYVRTYRLRDSWKVVENTKGIQIRADASRNGRKYDEYVVGGPEGEGQAWMHVGNWLLFRDVVDYEMTKLPNAVESQIRLYARSKGLAR